MAAIYDAQGNYIGDDGAPDLDQMKLELVKKNQPLASQIPGYGKPVPPAQTPPDPLAAAAGNFTTLATKFNPLMMMKSMQESVRTLNPAIPVAGAWADVAQNIQTAGAEAIYDILGNRQGVEKMQQNYVPVTTGRFYQEPTTQLGKEFETGVTKAMDASKIPAVWPMAMNQPIRPPITPNDVRVMGAEATRIGRQVKDIPTDFYNAQSGLQKLDPITGQPTYGAKLQGVAEGVGDIMAQREMQGLPPIPGLPASMQPMNPKLYAMRPEGSRVTSATLPATAKADAATYAPAQEIINNIIDSTTITPVQALDEIQNNILHKPEAGSARRAFESFLKTKANEMFPDAPSAGAALAAYKAKFSDREASAAHSLGMYDEFLNTPNGIQYRAALNLPSAEELPARHEAAANWLNSQFTNYIIEKVGTPNEPGAKLAGQGLTFFPPADVYGAANLSGRNVGKRREAAGMPAKTPTDEALIAADQQLTALVQQAGDAATRKRDQETIAKQLGYGAIDPNTGVVVEGMNIGRYEPFAQASRESDKANVAYKKQQKAVDNLRLGAAYENATDTAINALTAKGLKEEIEYGERQFYPALMQTPDTERAYIANPVQLRNLGFEDLAKSFYNDVMSGKIHLSKVPKMTVEKYIRDTAEGRIAAEKLAQAKEKQFKTSADNQFKLSADTHIPNDKIFGNVGALEITNRFTPEEVAKLVSEDTLALDVCIGEGGNVKNKPNPWHPGTGNRQYIPIYNIVTGQRDPDATSPRGAYINAVAQGSQMVSFRDIVTGEPIAIFDFNPSSSGNGKYDINFASGRKNGEVKPEYVEGIKSYLNSREDTIRGVSDKMNENLGIYDSKRMTNRGLAAVVNTPVSQFEKYDLSGMPRFVTHNDVHNYIDAIKATEPQVPVPAVLSQRPSESLEAYLTGAVSSAIDNILDSQRRAFDEAGESNQIVQAEDVFADIRAHFNEALRERGPAEALRMITQEMYDLESQYANSPRISANMIAEGIQDLIDDLQGHINYAIARQAAEAGQQQPQQPRAVAVRGDLMPNMSADELLAQYRDRLTTDQAQWLEDFGSRWDADVDDTPAGQGIQAEMTADFAHWRDNNTLLPEGRPDYLRMTHDAALQLSRQMGEDAGDEMRSVFRVITEGSGLDPVRDTDAFITALRGAAEVAARGTVEIALNELADVMESEYMRDWEPDVFANAPAPRQTGALPPDEFDALTRRVMADFADDPVRMRNLIRNLQLGFTDLQTIANLPFAQQAITAVALGDALERATLNPNGVPAPRINNQDEVAQAVRDMYAQRIENLREINLDLGNQMDTIVTDTANVYPPATMPRQFANSIRGAGITTGSETLRTSLTALANAIDAIIAAADQQPAANAPAPAQQAAQPFDFARAVDNIVDRVVQNTQIEGVGNRVETIAYRIAEQEVNPRLDPAGYAAALRARDFANEHVAVGPALRALADEISPPRGADLDNQRNDRIFQLENAVNDPELNPEDLRFLANELSNPLNQAANNHWISLAETERRNYAQALRQRANYIEFNPRDFAQRLMNEEGPEHYDDAMTLLENNDYDHEVLRGLAPIERARAAQATAVEMQRLLEEPQLRALNPNGVPPAAGSNLTQMSMTDLMSQITQMDNDTGGVWRRVNENTDFALRIARRQGTDPATVGQAISQGAFVDPDTTPAEREYIARVIAQNLRDDADYAARNQPPVDVTPAERNDAYEIATGLDDSYYQGADSPQQALAMVNQHLSMLHDRPLAGYNAIVGLASDDYVYSPALIQALITELELIYTAYRDRIAGGNAEGGPVRGYQKGGTVKKPDVPTPYLFSVPTYSETVAYEMYPGQKGQDDQRDAARHMLAAGTLSRKYSPGVAEFMGKAHEYVTSPLQAVKSMFGGQMPADYGMDTHNNRIGAQLGQRAKSQAELEDLVQAEAERASRTQTPDKAFIKKANGGIVQQNPTTDQMRYALTMRRK